jgi:hypothetical protein
VTHSFQIDPCEILGIAATASLREIREAYRTKTKKYHPDMGGDEWAFRVLTRSYEIVSLARVAGRASEEHIRTNPGFTGDGNGARTSPGSEEGTAHRPPAAEPGRARRGVRDQVAGPAKLVEVEMLLIRFETESPLGLLAESAEDRSLSCSLNIGWPIPDLPGDATRFPGAERTLAALAQIFESMTTKTRAVSASCTIDEGRFNGWLSYTTAARAEEAFQFFRKSLADHGLGVEQWVREMAIPRTWRD